MKPYKEDTTMKKEQIQMISFNVIANAGDAYDQYVKAIKAAKQRNFNLAEELMKKGEQSLVQAHKAQTDLLSAEVNGEELSFSILLIHAQDHFMHAMTYQQTAKDFIDLYKIISENNNY